MSGAPDRELQMWMDDWAVPSDDAMPIEVIGLHVRRRSRLLAVWVASEVLIFAAFTPFLTYRALTHPDPVERVVMAMLAAIVVAASVFSYRNWSGTWVPAAETTASFLELSYERCRRLQRAIVAGWVILGAEVFVFVPWIAHVVATGPGAVLWPWAWLAFVTTCAAAGLLAVRRWLGHETAALDEMRRAIRGSHL